MQSLARWPMLMVTVVMMAVGTTELSRAAGESAIDPKPSITRSTHSADVVLLPLTGRSPIYSNLQIQSEPEFPAPKESTTQDPQVADDSGDSLTTVPVTATIVPEAIVVTTTMSITPLLTITPTQTLTATESLVAEDPSSETPSEQSNPLLEAVATPTSPAGQEDLDPNPSLEGTIIVNRTDAIARFFVEGQTYSIPAMRSLGVDLPALPLC